jgi:hypothetical protein
MRCTRRCRARNQFGEADRAGTQQETPAHCQETISGATAINRLAARPLPADCLTGTALEPTIILPHRPEKLNRTVAFNDHDITSVKLFHGMGDQLREIFPGRLHQSTCVAPRHGSGQVSFSR